MTTPVPGYSIATPYGRRGPYWSCNQDANGNGIHTGVDYPAPVGTPVVAARPGEVVHCDHGAAFGTHQLEVLPGDGTRDFYAHMCHRVPNGVWVTAGQYVGDVGNEGNSTGPHLHFERHRVATGGWSCGVIVDPAPSLDYPTEEEDDEMNAEDWDRFRRIVADEVAKNNNDAAERVWTDDMKVTTPAGDTETKDARQVLREVWQRIAKAT